MDSKYTRINFILVVLFVLSMIYTTLELFSLQDELIINVNALSTDNITELSPVLNGLYIVVGLSLVLGLGSILFNLNASKDSYSHQVVQTQSKKSGDSSKDSNSESSEESTLDLSEIKNTIKANTDKKEKHSAILNALCKKLEAGQGAIYLSKESKDKRVTELYTSYAFHIPESEVVSFEFGEGLVGQVAVEGSTLNIDDIPENYINIVSGLGNASPKHLLVAPIMKGKKITGVVEIASFKPFDKEDVQFVKESVNLLTASPAKKKTAEKTEAKEDNKNE